MWSRLTSSIPGRINPQWRIDMALKSRARGLSYAKIARASGVRSRSTIWNWTHLDMSPSAIRARSLRKGNNRKLTLDDELVLAGYIVFRDCRRFDTGSDVLYRFAHSRFNATIDTYWTTRFCKRQDLSFRSIVHSTIAEFLRYRRDRAVEVLEEIRGLVKQTRNIWAFDKKPFTDRSDSGLQLGPTGSYS
jgi:transcriptional regulator with XRE-family HTH domain